MVPANEDCIYIEVAFTYSLKKENVMMEKNKITRGLVLMLMAAAMFLLSGFSIAETVEKDFVWMCDLKKARAKATVEKKPLFVVFRCEP